MSSSFSPRSGSSSIDSLRNRPIDPITRTALRYTISPREYELLHQYLISRAPKRLQKRTPDPKQFKNITKATSENAGENVIALRAALRLFVAVYVGMKGYSMILERLARRRGGAPAKGATQTVRMGNVRLAFSLSAITFFHRLLHRFLGRLRTSLLEDSAEPFRRRNPRVSAVLTSHFTPAAGAALAGSLLAVSPADQLRITLAIYVFTRSLEFAYNSLEDNGLIWKREIKNGKHIGGGRPWWFGSWMIMPFACGQLLHAFVFDRQCFPESYGRFILQRSPEYIQLRPAEYPSGKPWPSSFDIVDALAELSRLRWPPFVSPILFPQSKETQPPALQKVTPIVAPAHPGITHASCALLHPRDPSCLRTYVKYFSQSFPYVARFFTLIYGVFSLLAYKRLLKDPLPFLNRLSSRILRMSLFITGSIGTSWGSICLFNNYLPRHMLASQRWFLGGFLGGTWAFVARAHERSNFLYSARLSIDSFYKVGKKRGWWRGVKHGDVLLFMASLALLDIVYEAHPGAVKSGLIRKSFGALMRGEDFSEKAAASPPATSDEGQESQDDLKSSKVE